MVKNSIQIIGDFGLNLAADNSVIVANSKSYNLGVDAILHYANCIQFLPNFPIESIYIN